VPAIATSALLTPMAAIVAFDYSVEGETTIASRSRVSLPVKFYGSWKCPYTQRVWIGLEEKTVDYQWVDVDPNELGEDGVPRPMPLEDLRLRSLFACSPRGTLPALDNRGDGVHSTPVLLEYVHEAFDGPPLLPVTPHLRAQVRLWAAHVDARIVPHFDRLLSGARDPESRAEARSDMLRGLAEWEAAMAPEAEGPFFLGDDFSLADIALAPFWQRMTTVLRAYRRFDPAASPRLQAWYEAVQARPSFRCTVVDPERLIAQYADCADTAAEPGSAENARLRRSVVRPGRRAS